MRNVIFQVGRHVNPPRLRQPNMPIILIRLEYSSLLNVLAFIQSVFIAGLFEILRARVRGAGLSVSGRRRVSMFADPESSDRHLTQTTHR